MVIRHIHLYFFKYYSYFLRGLPHKSYRKLQAWLAELKGLDLHKGHSKEAAGPGLEHPGLGASTLAYLIHEFHHLLCLPSPGAQQAERAPSVPRTLLLPIPAARNCQPSLGWHDGGVC